MKRNVLNEIYTIKSRTEFLSRHDFQWRFNTIDISLDNYLLNKPPLEDEFLKYIPIAAVACIESFFKSATKELIDFGTPFIENVEKFNNSKNVKFDFETVSAIQSKNLTVGEFIAHLIPFSNLNDIDSNISILTSKSFLKELKKFKKKTIFKVIEESGKKFRENSDQIVRDIKRIFELRHVFCHEFAINEKVDQDEILRIYESCKIFIQHSNAFLFELTNPDGPETQTEMNIKASEDFEIKDLELNEIINKIKKENKEISYKINIKAFDEMIKKWKSYREARAIRYASIVEGGTAYSMYYSSSLIVTTNEMIQSLYHEFHHKLKVED